ncbi:MAG: HD-GYP domain-containing protein [Deferribacteraceae bacterium]|jgi:HD-GYP domain-containing protein (c-di-GMP phosphodiesterase class II)|nr:HD-GYP domain-containing protein [Deferribacteraceae bacterium]
MTSNNDQNTGLNEALDRIAGESSNAEMNVSWRTWLAASTVQERGIEIMKIVLENLRQGRFIGSKLVANFISDLASTCKNNEENFITIARLKNSTNYTYAHPVNVCVYCIALGSRLKLNDKQILQLGIAALLHDIGEVKLPDRMTSKSAKFTESEFAAMQRHPRLGYEILKRDPTIPEDSLMGIFHHHERLDGSGYPSGHVGRFIHPFGRIISVAETFDAMTTSRSRADAVPPSEALKTLYSLAGKHYEANVVKALISLLGIYPMGSLVRLAGGQLAVVLQQSKEDLSKPQVIVISDATGQRIDPYVVNLYGDKVERKIMYAENAYTLDIDTNGVIYDTLANSTEVSQITDRKI